MNKIIDLKLIATHKIIESKLSNMSKKKLLIFLKEEKDIHVLKSFILDGKIISNLDEHSQEIIDDRFIAMEANGARSAIKYGSGTGSKLAIKISTNIASIIGSGTGAGIMTLWALYRTALSKFDKCTKKCGTYELNSINRKNCMTPCKLEKAKSELKIITTKNCTYEKDPQKCKKKKQNTILKLKEKIINLEKIIKNQKTI